VSSPGDLSPQFSHPLHHRREIDTHAVRNLDPKPARAADRGGDAPGADDPFRGHAADVQAIATHQIAFDQGDFRAQSRRARRGDQSGGPGADDDQVVTPRGCRVGPTGRMDVRFELPVMNVGRQ
jgi:hypothetical protein